MTAYCHLAWGGVPIRLVLLLALLAGCAAPLSKPDVSSGRAGVESVVAARPVEYLLFEEARRLSARVASGELSRVQVADRLRAKCVAMVGRNAVDDAVFRQYRLLALARDKGQQDSHQAQQKMQGYLQGWLARWPQYQAKPPDPAFMRFMLMLYDMPALP